MDATSADNVSWTACLADERSGTAFAESAALRLRHLHACRRGNVTLLVLVMGFVFYAIAAMAWNTGQTTSAKIEAQTAADAAAYSAAVWHSRAMNVATGTNMLILRHSTAISASFATIPAWVMPWVEWIKNAHYFAVPCGPGYPACFFTAFAAYMSLEMVPMWLPFFIDTVPVFAKLWGKSGMFAKVRKLHKYQLAWIKAVPDAIERQTAAMEDYFGCDIELALADGSEGLGPPLVKGTPLTFALPYLTRVYVESWKQPPVTPKGGKQVKSKLSDSVGGWRWSEHKLPDPSKKTPAEGGFKWMFIGKAKKYYEYGFWPFQLIGLLYGGFNHVIPASQHRFSPLEFGPGFPAGAPADWQHWKPYTVVAVARKRSDNSTSKQPPRLPLTFMASGLFDDPVNPVAYAQAETFHGIEGHVPWGWIPYPYRLWTTWGWQWQPRLTHGNYLSAVTSDVFDFASLTDVQVSSSADVDQVTTH